MACCKAEEWWGWCEVCSTCYTDPIDGKEYCYFHAPTEHKGVSIEKFNADIHSLIEDAIAGKKKCYLAETVFPGNISFSQYGKDKPLPSIDFQMANFSGNADFAGAVFSGDADFTGAIFGGDVNFTRAIFRDNAGFHGANFGSLAQFWNTAFSGDANFAITIFKGETSFGMANFSKLANFKRAIFGGEALFAEIPFGGDADFSEATFSGATRFAAAIFSGNVNFSKVIFKGKTIFAAGKFSGDTRFVGASFAGDTDFLWPTFSGKIDLSKTLFGGNVLFYMNICNNGEADFSMATFTGEVVFQAISLMAISSSFKELNDSVILAFDSPADYEKAISTGKDTFKGTVRFVGVKTGSARILFKKVDFSAIPFSFIETDLTNFRFDRCKWPQKTYSGLFAWLNNKTFGLFTSEDTLLFCDEIRVDQDFYAATWREKLLNTNLSNSYGMVEALYRQMKVCDKEAHNEPEVSKWHYREKEMFRKKKVLRRYFPFSFTFLYWLFSGYGERPVRAGFMLILLFVVITVAMNWMGLVSLDEKTIIQGFSFSPDWAKVVLAIQTTIEHTLFVKDPLFKAQSGLGAIILPLWTKLFIPIQATLFAFSLRNKFRR